MAGDNFEGRSLAELHAMVTSAKPEHLSSAADALGAAAPEIEAIARDLRTYIGRVEWDGVAAENFREWGRGMVSETLALSDYTATASQEMQNSSQALRSAQAAVPKPDATTYSDPEKEERRKAEEEPKRQEAINQLNRLSSYYNTSGERMLAQPEPNFAPPPGDSYRSMERPYGTEGASASGAFASGAFASGAFASGAFASGTTGTPSGGASGGSAPLQGHTDSQASTGGPARPSSDSPVNTGIDSVTVAPPEARRAPPSTSGGPHTNSPAPAAPGPAGPGLAPLPGPIAGKPGSTPPQGATGPIRSGVPSPGSPSGGNAAGRSVPGGGRVTGPRPPLGIVIGEGAHAGRGPVGSPGTVPGAPAQGGTNAGRRLATQPGGPVGPRTPGTVIGEGSATGRGIAAGAGQVPGSPASRNAPAGRRLASAPGGPVGPNSTRGGVIGEGAVAGRAASGSAPVSGAPGPGGAPAGRRLASEPGGPVGATRTSARAHGEFNPAGTGAIHSGTPTSVRDRRRSAENRADYLAEDEETWSTGRHRTVPPVID